MDSILSSQERKHTTSYRVVSTLGQGNTLGILPYKGRSRLTQHSLRGQVNGAVNIYFDRKLIRSLGLSRCIGEGLRCQTLGSIQLRQREGIAIYPKLLYFLSLRQLDSSSLCENVVTQAKISTCNISELRQVNSCQLVTTELNGVLRSSVSTESHLCQLIVQNCDGLSNSILAQIKSRQLVAAQDHIRQLRILAQVHRGHLTVVLAITHIQHRQLGIG